MVKQFVQRDDQKHQQRKEKKKREKQNSLFEEQKLKRNYLIDIYKELFDFLKKINIFLCKKTIRLIQENEKELEQKGDLIKKKEELEGGIKKKVNKLLNRSKSLVSRLENLKHLNSRQKKFLVFRIMLDYFKIDFSQIKESQSTLSQEDPESDQEQSEKIQSEKKKQSVSECVEQAGKLFKKQVQENMAEFLEKVEKNDLKYFDLSQEFNEYFMEAVTKHSQFEKEIKDKIETIQEKRINKMERTKKIRQKKKDRVKLTKQNKLRIQSQPDEKKQNQNKQKKQNQDGDEESLDGSFAETISQQQSDLEQIQGEDFIIEETEQDDKKKKRENQPDRIEKKIKKPKKEFKNSSIKADINKNPLPRTEFNKKGRNKAKNQIENKHNSYHQQKQTNLQQISAPINNQNKAFAQYDVHPSWQAKQDQKAKEKNIFGAFKGTKIKLD